MSSVAEVERDFQAAMASGSAAAVRDFITVWPTLDMADLDHSFTNNYGHLAQMVVAQHRPLLIDAALEYYARMRELAGIVDGLGPVRVVDALPEQLLVWLLKAGPIRIKAALRKGWSLERAIASALVASAGTINKAVLDGARAQILSNVHRDPYTTGWARVSYSKKPCGFCSMLIGRGPDYNSRASAAFKAHRNCHCLPRPLWNRDEHAAAQEKRFADAWDASAGQPGARTDDSDYARLNEFRRYLNAQ